MHTLTTRVSRCLVVVVVERGDGRRGGEALTRKVGEKTGSRSLQVCYNSDDSALYIDTVECWVVFVYFFT